MVEQVERGAEFLDKVAGPDWIEKVNLDTLDLYNGDCCIAAQVVDREQDGYMNAWEYAMIEWGIVRRDEDGEEETDTDRSRDLGFLVDDELENYFDLDAGWRQIIAERIAGRETVPS